MTLQLLKPFRFQLLRFAAADCTKISLRGWGTEVWVRRIVRFWKRWVTAPLQQPLHHSQGCVEPVFTSHQHSHNPCDAHTGKSEKWQLEESPRGPAQGVDTPKSPEALGWQDVR